MRKYSPAPPSICGSRFFYVQALRNHVLAYLTMNRVAVMTPLRKETYELLAADESLNFIGTWKRVIWWMALACCRVADGFTETLCSNPLKEQLRESRLALKTAITGGLSETRCPPSRTAGGRNSSTTQMWSGLYLVSHRLSRPAAQGCQGCL